MNVTFRKSFARDIKKIKNARVLKRVQVAVEELETAETLQQVTHLKKMSGGGNFFRIRVGDYRIGIALDEESVYVIRCLHRRDIYRYFLVDDARE